MKKYKNLLIACLLSFGSFTIQAQLLPMYTHYMYNTLSINPAYAGSRDALTVTALNRSQWVDFKGAPTTQTITLHAPLRNNRIGLGASAVNDKIGPINNTSVNLDFAYMLQLTQQSKLALGISAGASILQANISSLELIQQNDPAFENNINNQLKPNVGFGAYYSRERFYAGISAPNLLLNTYSVTNQSLNIVKEQRHYFLSTGAIFDLNSTLSFKPTALIKLTQTAPIQGDITASVIINKRILVGAMIRTGDACGLLLGVDIIEQLHIGYSFDFSYGMKTLTYNKGSHELVLRYDFLSASKKQIHSPRYF